MSASYEYYRIFQCVAKHGNITAAAKELYLNQSTVSRTIQKLESELGVTLLQRSNKGIRLTAEGELLYYHTTAAVRSIQTAEQKIHQRKTMGEGNLHIGITEMTLQFFLLPFLEQFKKEYPGIHISLSYEYPHTITTPLQEGTMDLAVLTTPLSENSDLEYTPLMTFQDILIAGPDYFPLAQEKHALTDLREYPFILMEEGTSARDYIDRIIQSSHADIRAEYSLSSMPMILSMVRRNLGIGFIPDLYVTQEFFRDEVRRIYLKEELPGRQFCLITSKNYPMGIAAKEFIRFLL